MKSRSSLLLGLALVPLLFSGCAFSKTTVKLNLAPPAGIAKIAVDKAVTVEPMKDQRGGDPMLLANKGIGTKTSGVYLTETPVAAIVTDAIKQTLTEMGIKVAAAPGDLVLSGELNRLDSAPIMGFWSGQMDCTIQITFKLTDAHSGQILWTETFTGFNKKTGIQVDRADHRTETAAAAFTDLAGKLAASSSFRRALEGNR
jgi:hypothetical protein